MIHRQLSLHTLLLLLALVTLPVYSPVYSTAKEATVSYRMYYLFDPAEPVELQRATRAHRSSMHTHNDVEWIGIRRTSQLDVSFAPQTLSDMQAVATRFSPAMADWLQAELAGDQILVEAPDGRVYSSIGAELHRVVDDSGMMAGVPTDVGVTTWGKVKELFR